MPAASACRHYVPLVDALDLEDDLIGAEFDVRSGKGGRPQLMKTDQLAARLALMNKPPGGRDPGPQQQDGGGQDEVERERLRPERDVTSQESQPGTETISRKPLTMYT